MRYRICHAPKYGYFAQYAYFFIWLDLENIYDNTIYFKTSQEAEDAIRKFKIEQLSLGAEHKVSIVKYGRM